MGLQLLNHPLVRKADAFAEHAHEGVTRKFSGVPYIEHPREVALWVSKVCLDPRTVAAGVLHDVIEDTQYTRHTLALLFGEDVARLVVEVTNVSTPEDGNRQRRKEIDREYLARASARAQTVKLADILSNTTGIEHTEPKWARMYLLEKKSVLEVLTSGDYGLRELARRRIAEALDAIERAAS